ncbi:outer envelope pore protein 16, chloroplastic-like isoform X2 [Oryza glaberrima]|uniref:outer envelope pore protein 16, chloroplastic-like isoform X2 n=1 Tax=Oryza glaberrima TaxID=4538 RepID=UPI00224C0DEC|nr:outer envelope pore protein 16, chloroplastic-like isoform X2 [Oryza glaberrima]
MAHSGFSGSLTSPRFDLTVDMGHPFLNRTVDGFLKIGAVGACKVAAEETFECLHRGDVSKHKVESALKKMCKEGAYWVYTIDLDVNLHFLGMCVYAIEQKNAMVGGAVTGALVSAASNSHRQNVVKNAITGGAIATAAEFLNYLT